MRLEELPIEDRWILSRLATTTAAVTRAAGGLPLQRGGADDLRLHLVGVLRLVRGDEQGPAARRRRPAAGAARAGRRAGRASCGWCSRSCRSWPSRSGRRWPRRPSSAACRRRSRRPRAWCIAPWPAFPADVAGRRRWRRASRRMQELVRGGARGAQPLHDRPEDAAGRVRALRRGGGGRLPRAGAVHHAAGRRRPAGVRPGRRRSRRSRRRIVHAGVRGVRVAGRA